MGKQHLSRDDRIFMRGKLQGTRENMDMVAMVLMDKCGWHVPLRGYGIVPVYADGTDLAAVIPSAFWAGEIRRVCDSKVKRLIR